MGFRENGELDYSVNVVSKNSEVVMVSPNFIGAKNRSWPDYLASVVVVVVGEELGVKLTKERACVMTKQAGFVHVTEVATTRFTHCVVD